VALKWPATTNPNDIPHTDAFSLAGLRIYPWTFTWVSNGQRQPDPDVIPRTDAISLVGVKIYPWTFTWISLRLMNIPMGIHFLWIIE